MRKILWIVLLAAVAAAGTVRAQEGRSKSVVYIGGVRFYVHTVVAGQTLSSLSRLYEVDQATLLKHNPAAADGLKIDQTIKVPFPAKADKAAVTAAADRKARKNFTMHRVAQGETLYAIARRYEISVPVLLEDNPTADPSRLSIGQELRIRKKAIGKADDSQTRQELDRYADRMTDAADDGYIYRVVQPKETVYSLSRRYGLTEAEFIALNHLGNNSLQAGAIVRVPDPGKKEDAAAPQPEQPATPVVHNEVVFRAEPSTRPLEVALLLPVAAETRLPANTRFLDFYQGFLLGLQEVKQRGYSVNVTLYNTARDPEKIARIIASDEFRRARLIVGPVYEEELPQVVAYAQMHNIPVVTPLAEVSSVQSPVLFQMAPATPHKFDKLVDLLGEDRHVTVIRPERVDKDFEAELLPLLSNKSYTSHKYSYQLGAEKAETNDLSPLITGHPKNLFIVTASEELDVDRILASLASAATNLLARTGTAPDFVVLGSPKWSRFQSVDRSTFFKNRVVMLTSYAKHWTEATEAFDRRYIEAFGQLPSMYSCRGYDAAVIFCKGMFDDIQYNMSGRRYVPLQTVYSFENSPAGTWINREWMRLDYNKNFTVTHQ